MLRLRSAKGISKHMTAPQMAEKNLQVNGRHATKAASNAPPFPSERVSMHLYHFLHSLPMGRREFRH